MYRCKYLLNDDDSQVIYAKEWLNPEIATQIFETLAKELNWIQGEIKVWNKNYLTPRLQYFCGDKGIKKQIYSQTEFKVNPWIPIVEQIRDRIVEEIGLPLNSCLLNYYRDGNDYVSYHSDKDGSTNSKHMFHDLVVTISLGGSRDFYLKSKDVKQKGKIVTKGETVIKKELANGDGIIMLGQCQRDYEHSIPKRSQAEPRISLTYRFLR